MAKMEKWQNLSPLPSSSRLSAKTLGKVSQMPSRRRDGTQKSVQDIITLFKETDPDDVPEFVAKDLHKLPPVTFDHVDVTRLLKDITLLKQSQAEMQHQLEVSNNTISDLRAELVALRNAISASRSPTNVDAVNINTRREAKNASICSFESAGSNASPTAENACVATCAAAVPASTPVETMTCVGSATPKRAYAAIVAANKPAGPQISQAKPAEKTKGVVPAKREPRPGWTDISNVYGASGTMAGSGLGLMHALFTDNETRVGLIPVDYVNNTTIAAAYETAKRVAAGDNNIKIYTVTGSTRNPAKWVVPAKREPRPGWTDISNVYGASGTMAGSGLGLMHALFTDNETRVGLIPVDYVNNTTIAAAYETAKRVAAGDNNIKIYTVTGSTRNPAKWGKLHEYISTESRKYTTPLAVFYGFAWQTTNPIIFWIYSWLLHLIPAYVVDAVCFAIGKERRFVKIYKKMYKLQVVLSYFTCFQWRFIDDNTAKLFDSLSETDKVIFEFDVNKIDWKEYMVIWSYVHVSTAYAHACDFRINGDVLEDFYKSPVDPEALIKIAETTDEDRINKFADNLITNWPNTYSFAKAVAEETVKTLGEDMPLCIVRPAIGTFLVSCN
ncbi:hypothetical protein B5X24_HaOG210403 [Helicoverpa armigera]|uniref:Fatty acyl-CoA reductase n=1 Tax=Helicoverpa armigera TaxID=29058 RepID=A0A2W1BD17_HELAM|nr:hypothetical protein B5X24_HaOG210403 [Helicoverpa armigera]